MANIEVQIVGNNRELRRSVTDTEKQLSKLSKNAAKAGTQFESSFGKAKGSAKGLAGVVAGGLGASAAIAGFKAFGKIVDEVMANAQRQSELAKKAFEGAFSSVTKFNFDTPTFSITKREDAVKLGQIASKELGRVARELESNFGPLINSGLFQGALDKTLTAGSLLGIGEEEKRRFDLLILQRDTLQSQVEHFQGIATQLQIINKLSKEYEKTLGRASDQTIKAAQDALRIAPTPDRGKSILPKGGFITNASFGPLPGLADKGNGDILDPSVTIEMLKLERAVKAGVIPAIEGMRTEAGLLQEQLLFMLEQGVKPSNAEFQLMLGNMRNIESEAETSGVELKKNAVAFNVLSDIGNEALSGIAFKFEEANSKAAKLRNTVRGIGNRLLDIGISAGLNVGIGALTGNPLSFGKALASVVGVPLASAAPSTRTDSLSFGSISNAASALGGSSRGQELVASVQGTEFLVMLRESNNDSLIGGINI